MLKTYLPILVFAFLGLAVASVFMVVNHLIGPKKPKLPTQASRRQGEPYESGIPVESTKGLRFGVSFYLVAMLFILFDIEVIFLYSDRGHRSGPPTASWCSARRSSSSS